MAIMTHAKFHFNWLMLTSIFGIWASESPPPGPGERLKRPGLIGLRRIVQKRDGKVFHRKLGISYTTLRQEFIEHLSPFVDDVKKFGLHSIKSGGTSNPALRNVNGELLDRHVGWKNSKSKRRYVKFRTEGLLSVTEAMGI